VRQLNEDSRTKLLSKSKSSTKGKQRFNRRSKSKVANNVRQYNSIDMNKLFKEDILTVNISVKGETDDYTVKISFGGFLDILKDMLKGEVTNLNLRNITRSLITGFNKDDVYIFCSCPDFHYRFGYWATRNKLTSGEPEDRPSKITNPNDNLGSGCKHILLVLSNNSWLIKVASVINNYIKYMEKHYTKLYADVMFPAMFDRPYEEPVQLTFDELGDDNTLITDTDTLDTANTYNQERTKFQRGNKQGIRFASDGKNDDQLEIPLEDEQ
jgi:hypothetical protein